MTRVEITKSIFGTLRVRYDCPNCKERLRSPLLHAGKSDSCPNCRAQFTVPGTDALNREKQRQNAELELKEAGAKRKAEQREQERVRKRQETLELAEAKRVADEERRQRELEEAERIQSEKIEIDSTEQTAPGNPKPKRPIVYAAIAIVAFLVPSLLYSISTKSGAGITDVVRSSGLRTKLKSCASYGIVKADVYYDGAIATDVMVFDLVDGGSTSARRIDPVHLLLQFCDKIDLYSIQRIILARNGNQKFNISSPDMRPLAESYANGGKTWAFNHLPENLRTMSGLRAYDQWTGGWLGVLQKQTEDLNDFLGDWLGYSLDISHPSDDINFGINRSDVTREQVRKTLQEMEDNVPETLLEMENNLPNVIADMREQMMRDAAKYGLSKSEVEQQLREIEAAARDQIRGMESDVRQNIRDMEDDVIDQLDGDGF